MGRKGEREKEGGGKGEGARGAQSFARAVSILFYLFLYSSVGKWRRRRSHA